MKIQNSEFGAQVCCLSPWSAATGSRPHILAFAFVILLTAVSAFAAPKSASAYYSDAAFQYIENRLPSAEITCNEGLQYYPNVRIRIRTSRTRTRIKMAKAILAVPKVLRVAMTRTRMVAVSPVARMGEVPTAKVVLSLNSNPNSRRKIPATVTAAKNPRNSPCRWAR